MWCLRVCVFFFNITARRFLNFLQFYLDRPGILVVWIKLKYFLFFMIDDRNLPKTLTMTTTTATNYWTATAAAVTVATPDVVAPYNFKLTPEERATKSSQHQFGLCDSCDTGLNDRADFHCHFDDDKMTLTCNACDSYFDGGCAY